MQVVPPRDQPGSSAAAGARFTGAVHTHMVLAAPDHAMVNNVDFTPSARTYWHSHEGGQVLIVLAGRGLVQADGSPPRRIRAGDTVWAEPGERHWHGAGPDSYLVHTAISLGRTEWGEEVAESDYAAQPSD